MDSIKKIYQDLYNVYSSQGWWPLLDYKGNNPTKIREIKGYHQFDYNLPKTDLQRYEICIGAILAQNSNWLSVEKALINLKKLKAINPKIILKIDDSELKKAIKPTGYYNQKAKKLKEFTKLFISLKRITPTRGELLKVYGIGPETADSILLYAYNQPVFVIDAYTKRIFSRLGIKFDNYNEYQEYFHKNLPKDYKLFNEYHALLVELAKKHCKTKPLCQNCPLNKECKSFKSVL